MDFKVAGTSKGITAIQMDIKVDGLTKDILQAALAQAKKGRAFILGKMLECIAEPRKQLKKYAPKITTIKVNPEKIKDIIGPGGKIIKKIVEDTGARSTSTMTAPYTLPLLTANLLMRPSRPSRISLRNRKWARSIPAK